jgi:dipeptidyl aminopeptidase/acylaminoacyl peptidase
MITSRSKSWGLGALALAFMMSAPVSAQEPPQRQRPQQVIEKDPARVDLLYVSDEWGDHPIADYERDIQGKARTDSIYAAVTKGVVDYKKITYRSRIGDVDIPAYLFQPLVKRGPKGHAAMVWVHGGVHGNWGQSMWPFVREAVERGYVVICPDYTGSFADVSRLRVGYDGGGYELDDVASAYDYMVQNVPIVDPARVGIMGWSHGGYITVLSVTKDNHPFKAGAAIVPVTNLFQRLSWKGPSYQRGFSTQARIQGLPFEKREIYVERSPFYQVDKLNTPLLVHVATNDEDVDFEEDGMLVYKLRATKPEITETKIYVDPDPWGSSVGHSFSRRVNSQTLERVDSPAQRDSWNRTWAFLEEHLRPYEDPNHPVPVRTR